MKDTYINTLFRFQAEEILQWCFGTTNRSLKSDRMAAWLKSHPAAINGQLTVTRRNGVIFAENGETTVEIHRLRCCESSRWLVAIATSDEELKRSLVEFGFAKFAARTRREAAESAFKLDVIKIRQITPVQGCNVSDVLEEIRERLLEEGESPLQTTVDDHVHVFAPWGQMRFSALSNGNTVAVILWSTEPVEASPYDGRDDFNALVNGLKSAVDADSLAEFSEAKVVRLLRTDCASDPLGPWHE